MKGNRRLLRYKSERLTKLTVGPQSKPRGFVLGGLAIAVLERVVLVEV